MSTNFLGIRQTPLSQARFIFLPLPYDVTTSYIKGTDRGPAALIKASAQVETFDDELQQDITNNTSIHTLNAPPINFRARPEKFIPALERYTKSLLKGLSKEQILISLGGEHSISYPLVKAHQEIRSTDISVLHLDAHSDLRDSYNGSKYSHACVMKRIYDANVRSIVQVGIRNLTADCAALIHTGIRHPVSGIPKLSTHFAHTQPNYQKLGQAILSNLSQNVYVTIDLDVFDPSMMPALGTPEPGGLNWYQVLDILRPVFQKKTVVGFDVVELCPIKGNIISDFTAAKLIYRLMGYLNK
ncbi:MAG TPA: agmatinase [Planctomycetota bacterium]|nr:agmatinase [Planctomycetota bacterium]